MVPYKATTYSTYKTAIKYGLIGYATKKKTLSKSRINVVMDL